MAPQTTVFFDFYQSAVRDDWKAALSKMGVG